MINITALNSTSLRITWEKALPGDGNVTITNFTVCFDDFRNENFTIGCSRNITVPVLREIINNTARSIELTELNEATTYYVAIKAITNEGYGPLGEISNGTTLEDSKYTAQYIPL